ncbi:cation-transporting P-type ATPase [Ferribacterium limneticum]|uniref:cation-transporting P-type ATPase n=1 Tax=Ferribacterium limneticum TaxID=76259 RepID=UPI001CFBDA0A|nr:cation-transporting P-type ATPase [Ferribacterium limneticum]UCV28489.1 cation-transporting P-type ATPase [Ferribacterium limneticum]UCV32406.1 cation-transporting P-type ATPase [Ferribacterium limneticum]
MALPDPAIPAADDTPLAWHADSADSAARRLGVDSRHGLSNDEAASRLSRHGLNRLTETPGKPAWRRFAAQLTQPLVLVLIAAGVITGGLGETVDASVIFGVVLINAIIGYWQEAKAEGALAALARGVTTPVTVRRGGHRKQLDASQLVPGDVVMLAAGDRIPADLRLIQQHELHTDDSMLTGESQAVSKAAEPLPADTLLADRVNMAYAGTTVVGGQGAGLVIATGDATETGRIAGLIAAAPDLVTPLTRKMATFSNWLLWAIGGLALLTVAIGLARGGSAFDMFIAAVALAVGAIPEGLPAAVTVTLAIGVARMARRRTIIRHLPAVETLGSTTVICSDKTGTLTENAMTVRVLWCGGEGYAVGGHGYAPDGTIVHDEMPAEISGAVRECLIAGALCNDASLNREGQHWKITGDPTEAALLVAARKGGLDEHTLQALYPRHDVLPFDANRQFMATAHGDNAGGVIYVKGALERLLPRCIDQLGANGQTVPVDGMAIEKAACAYAGQGMRVLLLARRDFNPGQNSALNADAIEKLTLIGLVAMIDPPRKAVIGAIRNCHSAGIRVKMITGDHAVTAQAIARQIGLSAERALTGRELALLDDVALIKVAHEVDVFARVEPEQKLRLVRALQARGEVVAMTGDGVNDAPALKQADIGIAMGLAGTEVAKEAAAMVLTDDNFASIEAAVEEGRGVWDNLVKFITWTLPTNFGEGLVIVAAILFGATLPITPLQILWINMTTAVLLGLPLAFEPIERGIMHRAPRRLDMPVLDAHLIRRIVLVSFLLLAGAFGLFLRELEQGHTLAEARTVAVNVFVMVEMAYLFNCRSLTHSFWKQGLFSNPWIWAGIGSMLALQLLLTYWPPLNAAFQTAPIGWQEWLEIGAFAWLASLIIAIEKYGSNRARST